MKYTLCRLRRLWSISALCRPYTCSTVVPYESVPILYVPVFIPSQVSGLFCIWTCSTYILVMYSILVPVRLPVQYSVATCTVTVTVCIISPILPYRASYRTSIMLIPVRVFAILNPDIIQVSYRFQKQ